MKRSFWRLLSVTSLLSASQFANASLINVNGYSLNTETNIVSDGTLEWLQWDETKGLSIEAALDKHTGWGLATNNQMANLFNNFFTGMTWESIETGMDYEFHRENSFDDVAIYNSFLDLFGYRLISTDEDNAEYTQIYENSRRGISSYYGSDEDGDGFYKAASVRDWSYSTKYLKDTDEMRYVYTPANATLHQDRYSPTDNYETFGVALVRTTSVTDSTEVSEPTTALIFALGIFGMLARKFKG